MKIIHLHGSLKQKFGATHRLEVKSPAEAIHALSCTMDGFRTELRRMHVKVIRGRREDAGWECDLEHVAFQGGKHYHIVPVIHGAGSGGGGKIIAGIALIALTVVSSGALTGAGMAAFGTSVTVGGVSLGFTYGAVAMFGAAMLLGGIAMAMAPAPKAPSSAERETPDERPSFVFNGPVNTSEQGGPIPLVYGRHLVGSHIISAGLSSVGVSVDSNSASANQISDWITSRNPLAA